MVESKSPQAGGPAVRLVPRACRLSVCGHQGLHRPLRLSVSHTPHHNQPITVFVGAAALVTAYYSFKRPAPDSSSPRLPRIGEMPSEARGSTGGKIATNKGSIGGEKR